MNIKSILNSIEPSEDEIIDFNLEIMDKNISRLKIFAVAIFFLSLFHIIFLMINDNGNSINYKLWSVSLLNCHIIDLLYCSFFIFFIFYIAPKLSPKNYQRIATFYIIFSVLYFSFVSVYIASVDQYIIEAISPFILVTIMLPLIVNLKPFNYLLIYTLQILFFILLIPHYQPNNEIILSHKLNAISAVLLGFGLSLSIWKVSLKNYRQDQIIRNQQLSLENQNSQLLMYTDELRSSNVTKDKFFSIIAHDLRSPLGSFMTLTKLLREEFETFTESEKMDVIKLLSTTSGQVFSLLENLLEWSRSQRGLINIESEIIDIHQITNQVINLMKLSSDNKQIKIFNQIPFGSKIFADPNISKTIFRNIISNSIKFTNPCGEVNVSLSNDSSYDIVTISDNGVGMTTSQIDNLFNFEVNSSTEGTENEKGTGLGLILCKELIEKHKGMIKVSSALDNGSRFSIFFPRSDSGII